MVRSRRARTHAALLAGALDLFEEQGFEETTVAQIAATAGVTPMTFFRHFENKESVLLEDPYDPAIADAIANQPYGRPPLVRAVDGVATALRRLPEPETDVVRRRVRIIAGSPTLRAASARRSTLTEDRIAAQLLADGADEVAARAAAAALMASLTAALFAWAADEGLTIAGAIESALGTLVSGHG